MLQKKKKKIVELKQKFDELKQLGFFENLKDLDIFAKYLILSFLVNKLTVCHRHMILFGKVYKYAKPLASIVIFTIMITVTTKFSLKSI